MRARGSGQLFGPIPHLLTQPAPRRSRSPLGYILALLHHSALTHCRMYTDESSDEYDLLKLLGYFSGGVGAAGYGALNGGNGEDGIRSGRTGRRGVD